MSAAVRSASREFPGVSDLAPPDRPHRRCFHRDNGCRGALERRELDLKSSAVLVGVNDRPDIARLKTFGGHSGGENDAVKFLDRHSWLTL